MSHAHSHGPLDLPARRLRRIRLTLAAIVVPLALLTAVGMAWLWPSSENSPVGSIPALANGTTEHRVKVSSLDPADCAPTSSSPTDPRATPQGGARSPGSSGDAPGTSGGTGGSASRAIPATICAQVSDGDDAGKIVSLQIPPEVFASLKVGSTIRTLHTDPFKDQRGLYYYWDMERSSPMMWLIGLYLVLVVVVARWRGAAAIAGLGTSILVLVYFVMPALMSGESPLLVTIVGVLAMMFTSVYFAHGISIRTTTALLGTMGGLLLTSFLALYEVDAGHLSGATSEDALLIFGFLPSIKLSALLVCGIVIAGLGALNDVAITQASAVWELHAANPTMGRARLFARAMRIGRDHIASTVYTLAFAYAGTALPALLLALMVDRQWWDIVTSSAIAEEIVRTLIASIGLLISIPLTTFVGALLIELTKPGVASLSHPDSHPHPQSNSPHPSSSES